MFAVLLTMALGGAAVAQTAPSASNAALGLPASNTDYMPPLSTWRALLTTARTLPAESFVDQMKSATAVPACPATIAATDTTTLCVTPSVVRPPNPGLGTTVTDALRVQLLRYYALRWTLNLSTNTITTDLFTAPNMLDVPPPGPTNDISGPLYINALSGIIRYHLMLELRDVRAQIADYQAKGKLAARQAAKGVEAKLMLDLKLWSYLFPGAAAMHFALAAAPCNPAAVPPPVPPTCYAGPAAIPASVP